MTVKELKNELKFYDDDTEIIFEIDDDVEVESITESKYGWKTANINVKLKPSSIWEYHGTMLINLEVAE